MEGDREEDGSQCNQAANNHQAQHKYVNNQSLILLHLSFSHLGIVSQPYSNTSIATISVINSVLSLLFFSFLFFSTGGTKFSVSKEKLLQHKGSLFAEMIVSNHSQQLPSGEYVSSLPIYLSNTSVSKPPAPCFPFPSSQA